VIDTHRMNWQIAKVGIIITVTRVPKPGPNLSVETSSCVASLHGIPPFIALD